MAIYCAVVTKTYGIKYDFAKAVNLRGKGHWSKSMALSDSLAKKHRPRGHKDHHKWFSLKVENLDIKIAILTALLQKL